jgi:oligopeptide transport system substrate-binding protein
VTRPILPAMRRLSALLVVATLFASCGGQTAAGPDRPVKILSGSPTTLDPAAQGDAGSAAVTAQLFESLTSFDADLQVRPALAESWQFSDDGRQVTFHLRPGSTFSDGTPLRPSDVVRSWLRLIDPAAPSPLASLALDIAGAEAYLRGATKDPATVGMRADDGAGDLVVDLARPATDFVNIVAGPTFSIVPPGVGTSAAALAPGSGFVGSGGYTLSGTTATGLTLTANPRYWAGKPAITTIELVDDLGGRGPVDAFAAGDLDYTSVFGIDATWLAYDETLGPQLRLVGSLSVQYYGFDTSNPPFDDPLVRQAFGKAIDWRRMAALSSADGTGQVANSMVPPGIPGRSDEDFLPPYDPAAARDLLAQAGFPGGVGFPATVMLTGGTAFDAAIVAEVKRELGITLQAESMGDGYFDRLSSDVPQMWSLAWVADYPGRNDFLGVLLSTGASNNYGHWSSPTFDAAILEATSASDPAVATAAYDRAERVVRDDVPVVPVVYGPGWALSRTGLLGAGQNGLGIVRMAGLAWAD